VKTLRSQPQFRGLRIMMVTIENDLSQVAEALEAGVDEYLMKPFTREMIHEKLLIMGLDAPLRAVP
jgi:two-component system chemotaxis response regulator CheY